MSPDFQKTFNRAKESIPARIDLPLDGFDECAIKSHRDLEAATHTNSLLPSLAHELAVSRTVRGEFLDAVTNFFDSDQSSEDAVRQLASAVKRAG